MFIKCSHIIHSLLNNVDYNITIIRKGGNSICLLRLFQETNITREG